MRTNVVRALAEVVATIIFILVQTECVCTHVVCTRADVVATKLCIILPSSFLPLTVPPLHSGPLAALKLFFFGWLWQRSACAMGK